jgi:hypothetical protein
MVTTNSGKEMPPPMAVPDERGAEQRREPRFALLLRTAKLVAPQGEFLCIIRDVSAGGVRLRLFHGLPEGYSQSILELGNGDQFPVDLVWQGNGEAGFRFSQKVDLEAFVSEASPYPKRPIRLRMDVPAVVSFADRRIAVRLRNISRQGACIESEELIALHQALRIESRHLPEQEATVCWRKGSQFGLVLDRIMPMADLAERAAAMQGAL